MKQSVTMKLIKDFDIYTCLNPSDYRFGVIWQLFNTRFEPKKYLNWLYDNQRIGTGNEFFDICKKKETIALYDRSGWLEGEEYLSIFPDENKRFDMTYKNFEEILLQWEELRVSMSETILIVIHEDNHVSLETDPVIIKEYQDAGYAFDIDKTVNQ